MIVYPELPKSLESHTSSEHSFGKLPYLSQINQNIYIKEDGIELSKQDSENKFYMMFDKEEEYYLENKPIFDTILPIVQPNQNKYSDCTSTLTKKIFKIVKEPQINIKQNTKKDVCINRKEKSLGELSKKFLKFMHSEEDCPLSLDSISKKLEVERRRIYDIINILESLGIVKKKGKNNYTWKGLKEVPVIIDQCNTQAKESKKYQDGRTNSDFNFGQKTEKSLALLSIGFIKLFLQVKNIFSLEEAAKLLNIKNIENDQDKLKTRIRRLYDIANVFMALGLIKKISYQKKPAFYWLGLEGFHAARDNLKQNKSSESPIQQLKIQENTKLISQFKEENVKNNEDNDNHNDFNKFLVNLPFFTKFNQNNNYPTNDKIIQNTQNQSDITIKNFFDVSSKSTYKYSYDNYLETKSQFSNNNFSFRERSQSFSMYNDRISKLRNNETPLKLENPKKLDLSGIKRKAPITLIDKYETKINKIFYSSEENLMKKRSCSEHFILGNN